MRIVICCEEKTFHKRGFFVECKSSSFNSILRRPVPRRYIGNILTRYIGKNASENLIDNSLIKKIDLAQQGFFKSVIYWSVYSLVDRRSGKLNVAAELEHGMRDDGVDRLVWWISLDCLAVVIGIHAWTGFFDFSAVTTDEIRTNPAEFANKSVKVKNATLLGYRKHQRKDGVVYELRLLNGETWWRLPQAGAAITVYARAGSEEQRRLFGFGWQVENGVWTFPELQLLLRRDGIVLQRYAHLDYATESWFRTPYYISLRILNTFLPLSVSVIAAMFLQLIVIGVIVWLVVAGFFYLVAYPSP